MFRLHQACQASDLCFATLQCAVSDDGLVEARTPSVWSSRQCCTRTSCTFLTHICTLKGPVPETATRQSDIGLRPSAAAVPTAALDGVEDPPDVAGHRLEARIMLFHPGVGLLDIPPVLF